ncbi:uncharacterized protein LOC110691464 [Chenopodium quinoa]|uniref:uncharacterized protein LOC110691464 n=1 Tax=Chenopodium quinoa TaxID=63459 RepID=UPI000B774F73|nr:uncharacterized protein LOC110691464 [Chenopodium quinoa]
MEDEPVLRQSESNSMISSMVGRVMNTLLISRPKKLEDAIVKLGKAPKSTFAVTLDESLRVLNKYVRDAVDEEKRLDEVLIPMIENLLRCKESKHPNQTMILMNWLFQDEALFLPLAKDLVNIISRRKDRYIALGWCKLVRSLLMYDTKMTSFSKNGFKSNHQALLKILSSSIGHLSVMVKNGSVLQDGFELPTRLSAAAADCILVLTEALTQKLLESGNLNEKGAFKPNRPISIFEEKQIEQKNMSFEASISIDGRLLLWQNLDQLIVLVQKLQSWSQKSRTLHAKGLGQILKWLQQIESSSTRLEGRESGSQFQTTGVLLLSSCWKHYSMLSLLEDIQFYQRVNELVEQYLSGIEFYNEDNLKDHVENKDRCVETMKFFLNCLALLLGRLDQKFLESTTSLYGQRISRALLSLLHCADEDVVNVAVCIFRFVILKIAGSNFNDPIDCKEFLMPLLGLLDERDGASRAVTALIADFCSITSDDWCLNEVLKRLASGSICQRSNAADVISELIRLSSNSTKVTASSFWPDIANQLLDCLSDEDNLIRSKATSLLLLIDPSLVLPALVRIISTTDGTMKSAAINAFAQVLRLHNTKFEVIRMVLDSLSDLNNKYNHHEGSGGVKEESTKYDPDEVFRLIPEWSKAVQDWNLLVGPLVDKMLSEPTNAILVRFLSCVSEYLADAVDLVLGRILVQMQEQEEMIGSVHATVDKKTCKNDALDKVENMLFDRLCPLLVIKVLPLRVFDDFNCMTMYGQALKQRVANGTDNIDVHDYECVATLLFNRAFSQTEYEDVRKLAAELCGRIHPQILFPVALSYLQRTAESKDAMQMKSCLFAVCTSLSIRGWDSASHPDVSKIIRTLRAVLLWPSVDGDEVSKVQHGCIDCLALIICAESQAPKTVRGSAETSDTQNALMIQTSGALISGSSVLSFVIDNLIKDNYEAGLRSKLVENTAHKTCISISFRLCMANVLISACQKMPESVKNTFARKTLPRLISSTQDIENAEIRAACVQVLFSAACHLKLGIVPYAHDLLKISFSSLRKEAEQEKMAGAKLMASLMASDDAVIERISGKLLEARSILLHVSTSDPSPQLRQVCQKLLVCLTSQ